MIFTVRIEKIWSRKCTFKLKLCVSVNGSVIVPPYVLSEICHLRRLPKLRVLWLADNPCAVGDRYRMTVLKTLPNLQKLDNKTVTEDEVNEAIEQGLELSFNAGNARYNYLCVIYFPFILGSW